MQNNSIERWRENPFAFVTNSRDLSRMDTPVESDLQEALSGQYELEQEIGRGGMGVVYRARDVRLDRTVAIKVLPPDLSGNPELHERFLREARIAAGLSHPNIVPIYRADEINGRAFFVMEYVDGASLGERVRESGPIPAADAVRWLREVALALGCAHSRGVIHRDVKPENILIEASGRAKIADFGIARVAQASHLTSTGQVLGSVHFMSPEQVTNEPLDGRSDLYSLGVVAFFALSGKLPFSSDAVGAVLVAHVTTPAPSLRSVAPNVSEALSEIVTRCLRKDPAQRYQSGEELAQALEAVPAVSRRDHLAPDAQNSVISEDDAARLWKRASELQAEAASRGAISSDLPTSAVPLLPRRIAPEGYKLRDARAAAVEAGISERYVALALNEIQSEIQSAPVAPRPAPKVAAVDRRHFRLAGAPMLLDREVTIEGEVPADVFEQLVETMQHTLGDMGHVSTLGRSLVWSAQGQSRKLQVTVNPRHGRTTIRVTEQLSPIAGGLFGGIIGGMGGGGGGATLAVSAAVFHSAALGVGAAGGIVAGAYLLARKIFVSVANHRARAIDRLIAQLTAQVKDAVR